MLSLGINDDDSSNFLDENDNNININFFDSLKEKGDEINQKNIIKENEIKDIKDFKIQKENDSDNSPLIFQKIKKFFEESKNLSFETSEPYTDNNFLNRKRNHGKINDENENDFLEKEDKKEKENIKGKDNKRGKKKKNLEYNTGTEHDKFREDNIIQKIKGFVFKYILELLNKSLKDTKYKFYPLTKELNENLKKDFNEKLLDRTIEDIFINSDLNKRYLSFSGSNKLLIKKIYAEENEKETINILKKTFKDILDYIREKDSEYFLNTIRDKEIRNSSQMNDSYLQAVKLMLYNYEFWFKIKLGRNGRKKSKN